MTKGMKELLEKYGVTEKAEEFEGELNKVLSETWIPKSVFNETNEKLKLVTKESADKDALLNEAKNNKTASEELQKKFDALTESHKAERTKWESELAETKKGYAIDTALNKAGAKSLKAVKSLMDMNKILASEDGSYLGLDEQVSSLQKDYGYMFESAKPDTPNRPSFGNGNGNTNPLDNDYASRIAGAMGI